MIGLMIPRKAYVWGAVAALVVAGGVYLRIDAVRDERARQDAVRANQHIQTMERINDAISDPRTPDDIRRRLRELAE